MCSGFFCLSGENIHEPVAQRPVAQQPVAQRPVAQQPVAQRPVAQQPVAQQPVAQQPVAPQPDNIIKTSLDERIENMHIIRGDYIDLPNAKEDKPYGFVYKQKIKKDIRESIERETTKPIFTTNIQKDGITYEIVIKVMVNCNNGNLLEKNIMVAIRDQIISNKLSKHFLLIYFYSLYQSRDNILQLRTYNEPVENSLRYLIMNDYVPKLLDDNTFCNLLIQSLLSIGTYHNLTGYVHMDTHTGNFLYANNSEHNIEGYYQYILDGETYYLKSCGYNVMIYDFGDSNKIKIPIDKIKRFELFYDKEEIDIRKKDIRASIVIGKQYSVIDKQLLKEQQLDGKRSIDDLAYVKKIETIFTNIQNKVNYYRIKILIDDYCIFLQDLRVFFVKDEDVVEDIGKLSIIDSINDEIEALKKNYLGLPLNDITDDVFYGYAKEIFKRVLDICITHFPNLLTQGDKPLTVLNATPFLLYQEEKIVVEEVADDAL